MGGTHRSMALGETTAGGDLAHHLLAMDLGEMLDAQFYRMFRIIHRNHVTPRTRKLRVGAIDRHRELGAA